MYHQISSPFSKGTSFSRMLLPGPFRTTTNFDLSVYIGPTSVSLYKWTLYSNPLVCAKRQVDTFISLRYPSPISLWFLKGPSFRSRCLQYQERSIWTWNGEQLTKWPLGSSSDDGWRLSSWQTKWQGTDSGP